MTHRGPFQPLLFCDSVIYVDLNTIIYVCIYRHTHTVITSHTLAFI